MDQNKVNMFLMSNSEYFSEEAMVSIRDRLLALPDEAFTQISTLQFKSPVVTLVISLFVGGLGIDRFFVGDVGLGVLKLLTCGGCGIWTIIDWFMIMGITREKNMLKLMNMINMLGSGGYKQYTYSNPNENNQTFNG